MHANAAAVLYLRRHISDMPVLKLHAVFARAVCRHTVTGKTTEVTKKKRLAFVDQCVRQQAREGQARGVDVVIVATRHHKSAVAADDATRHHQSEEAAHKGTNVVMGVVRMGGSKRSTLAMQSYKQSWARWKLSDPSAFNLACDHVARGMMKDGNVFEYPIVASIHLEQENIRVQCPPMREFIHRGAIWQSPDIE